MKGYKETLAVGGDIARKNEVNISIPLKYFFILLFTFFLSMTYGQAQSEADSTQNKQEKKYQAKAPETQPFGTEAFEESDKTTIRWLGMAGFLINSRGTTIMIDPLLKGFDMPIMIDFPIATEDVPRLSAVLVTHSDNDHYSIPTNRDLAAVTKEYHSTV